MSPLSDALSNGCCPILLSEGGDEPIRRHVIAEGANLRPRENRGLPLSHPTLSVTPRIAEYLDV
jgi:hypothetical protein